jgi:hypothetical protein
LTAKIRNLLPHQSLPWLAPPLMSLGFRKRAPRMGC